MFTILLAVVLGIFFTLVAVDNSQLAIINLFGSTFSLPLYIHLALAFLFGVLVASITSVFDWTGAFFDLRKKESNYNNIARVNENLQHDLQKIESENLKLKEELNSIKVTERERKNVERKESIRNFFHRLTHPQRPEHGHLA